MRCQFIAAVCLLVLAAVPLFADSDASVDAPIISCGNGVPGGISCTPSKKDEKEARTAYARGLRLEEHKHIDQAFLEFDEASRLVSEDTKFFAAREVAGNGPIVRSKPATRRTRQHPSHRARKRVVRSASINR